MDNKTTKGRPRIDKEPLKPTPVTLRPKDVDKAKELGDGNISAGIRKALDLADEDKK